MTEFEKLCDFGNLYKAHCAARLGKRKNRDVIQFEMRLAENLTRISDELKTGKYRIHGYYTFKVHDPKERDIHALHYRDRIVQHCLCDEILMPALEKRLIYDNAACRIGKGTDFARNRLTGFMRENYRKHGSCGYFLKCDIHKFFDNIDHEILKQKLRKVFSEQRLLDVLDGIIDSYETAPGKGLPLGNQTSQWFAIWYLDGLDRLVKEKLRVKYYTRYMDDMIIVHHDKEYLKDCLEAMRVYIIGERKLAFNAKTQIFPVRNGAEYLGFRFCMNCNGRIIKRLGKTAKTRFKHRMIVLQKDFAEDAISYDEAMQSVKSYLEHLSKGDTFHLKKKVLGKFVLRRKDDTV